MRCIQRAALLAGSLLLPTHASAQVTTYTYTGSLISGSITVAQPVAPITPSHTFDIVTPISFSFTTSYGAVDNTSTLQAPPFAFEIFGTDSNINPTSWSASLFWFAPTGELYGLWLVSPPGAFVPPPVCGFEPLGSPGTVLAAEVVIHWPAPQNGNPLPCDTYVSTPTPGTWTTAKAGTVILSVSGPAANNALGIFPTDAIAVSFTVGQSYSNVTISADLIGNFTGTVYLTNQIGPRTTAAANEIAAAIFTSSNPGITLVGTLQPVLTGVTLQPGTYYLVFTGAQVSGFAQGIQNTLSPTITADVGASQDGFVYYTNSPSGYIPADSFLKAGPGTGVLEYAVTGTPISGGCTVTPSGRKFTAAGGLGSFLVTNVNCNSTPAATTSDSWITLLPGPYVCARPTPTSSCPPPPASGSVQFAIAKNPTSSARTGQILVSGQAFTVAQAGVSSICSFSVTPLSQVAPAAGGPLTPVRVVASSSSCTWGASVNAGSALQVTSGQSGTGNGIVSLSVSPNSGATRTLTATIAGQTVSVQQNGPSLVCGAVDVSSSVTIRQVSFSSGWPGLYFGVGSDAETISIKNNTSSTLQNLFLVLHGIPVYPIPATSPEYSLVIPASQNTSCFRTPLPEQMISLGSIGSQQTITVDMSFNFINDYYGHGMNSWTLLSGLPNK